MTLTASDIGRALQAQRPRATLTCSVCDREFEGVVWRPGQPRVCSNACKQRRKRAKLTATAQFREAMEVMYGHTNGADRG